MQGLTVLHRERMWTPPLGAAFSIALAVRGSGAADFGKSGRDHQPNQFIGYRSGWCESNRPIGMAVAQGRQVCGELRDDVARMRVITAVAGETGIAGHDLSPDPEPGHCIRNYFFRIGQAGFDRLAQVLQGGALVIRPVGKVGIYVRDAHSAAFISNPLAIWSAGATGY